MVIGNLDPLRLRVFIFNYLLQITSYQSKSFPRINHDGDWPVVHQLHFHHCLKFSGLAANAGCTDLLDEILIEPTRLLRTRSRVKRRTLAATHVSVQCELRDGENRATDFRDCEVHLLVGIFKYPHTDDLVGQVIGVRLGVLLRDSEQYQQPLLDLPDSLAANFTEARVTRWTTALMLLFHHRGASESGNRDKGDRGIGDQAHG